jgi:hypothetical protein
MRFEQRDLRVVKVFGYPSLHQDRGMRLPQQIGPFSRRGHPASDFTNPRSLERFDIPEGMLDHSVG